MGERRAGFLVGLSLVALAAAAGCRGWTSSKPPIHVNPSMDRQPKYRAQAESAFFYDGAAMRQPVPGTVARGELREDRAFFEGKDKDGKDLEHSPVEATPERLARGGDRYRIYCAPCHDARGNGKGILAAQGLPTTSLHIDRLRAVEDGYLFEVITNGRGLMPGYRWPIPPADRWAIIAHVREIQKQQPQEGGGATP
jgi:mono/diheme cytochrome c family protein